MYKWSHKKSNEFDPHRKASKWIKFISTFFGVGGGQWEALGKLGWWELQAGVDSGRDAYGRGKVLRNSKMWPILEWIASK